MSDDEMLTMREKSPTEFGERRFYVELLFTQRNVVSVYADSEDVAIKRAKASPYFSKGGALRGFKLTNGVSSVQYDEEHECAVTIGEVQREGDDEDE